MEFINISGIKPDPNQPRRTFDADKMAALVASITNDGFREEYPILIDGKNVIIDGERRWRAATEAGIKSVPVEVKKDILNWERLLYQLQSEGSELEVSDKYVAWHQLWKNSGQSLTNLSKALGLNASTFSNAVKDYDSYLALLKVMKAKNPAAVKTVSFNDNFGSLSDITSVKEQGIKEKMAEKSIKEKWTREKTREIRQAIDEKPLQKNAILSHDYSGDSWKTTLEVAKAGFSDAEAKELVETAKSHEAMEEQVDAFMDIFTYGLKLGSAMRRFDYTKVLPAKRVELHKKITKFMPFVTDYIRELETYMLDKGELQNSTPQIKDK
jgi:ParB/RepB/Spo0J family partition protein